MNNTPTPPSPQAPQGHSPLASPFKWIYLCLIGLTLLVAIQWWQSTSQMNALREELARRLQTIEANSVATKTLATTTQEANQQLQIQVGILENKQEKSHSHALALQQLYQDLSKTRDDWALAEIEQVLSTASQQLQLAGNISGALIALQNADTRLARSDKPQFITIRRAIARDIDKLKALPNLDLPGIALHLDNAISHIDTLPLWIDEKPVVAPTQPNKPIQTAPPQSTLPSETGTLPAWLNWLNEQGHSWTTDLGKQLRDLVRIRRIPHPEALLLAPSQSYFVKENIKLRLLNARLALLSRNETLFKQDLLMAANDINRYFDTQAKQTQAVQALLRQIQHNDVSIEMPTLVESLEAVRNFTMKSLP